VQVICEHGSKYAKVLDICTEDPQLLCILDPPPAEFSLDNYEFSVPNISQPLNIDECATFVEYLYSIDIIVVGTAENKVIDEIKFR
jgi:hypothetical protein